MLVSSSQNVVDNVYNGIFWLVHEPMIFGGLCIEY